MDSAFGINTLRNYALNPLRYTHHIHKDLLLYASNIMKARVEKGLTTHIGKVKSHTGVTYNDAADTGACGVVGGDILPDITFTTADPDIIFTAASERGHIHKTPTNATTPNIASPIYTPASES